MTHLGPLGQYRVAISISKSPNLEVLGLSKEHLDDAMAEVARYLLAMGSQLIYGGDLRPKGFTELLFELVARHRRNTDIGDERVGIVNVLAWPVHVSLSSEQIENLSEALRGAAELVFLTADGRAMLPDERKRLAPRPAADPEWATGLSAMRVAITKMSDARIVLGGEVDRFKGTMPGVAEETLLALQAGQPLFLLGGFGGCARDIAEDLGLISIPKLTRSSWTCRASFLDFSAKNLNNGLSNADNETLATTVHLDQAVALILRGLLSQRNTGGFAAGKG